MVSSSHGSSRPGPNKVPGRAIRTMLKEACAMKHKEWAIPQSFLAIACAVLMLLFSVQVFAQAGIDMGSVTGTVKDQSGAVVQKAQCTLTNVNTGTSQKAISTSVGAYV